MEENKHDPGRSVSATDRLLSAPSALTGPGAGAPPASTRETSAPTQTTEGGGDCGDCPACKINDYLDDHGNVVTEVVEIGEGVWIGPDKSYFDEGQFDMPFSMHNGIGVIATERDSEDATRWVIEQLMLAAIYGGTP